MLRIHFNSDDRARVRVAAAPDPLWETALSLHLLQNRESALLFDPWRREVRLALARAGLSRAVQLLTVLYPCCSYFPDFLTPGRGDTDIDTAIDTLLCTPPAEMAPQFQRFGEGRPLPSWTVDFAAGDPRVLASIGRALRRYYEIAVEPYLGWVRTAVGADRSERGATVLSSGFDGLLGSYAPFMRWESPVLSVDYPTRRDMQLEGRGLTLVPSFFCVRRPISLADDSLPPVLVHPVDLGPGWLSKRDPSEQALPELLGATRAAILESVDVGRTTTELAAMLRLSLSTVSRHAAVLREAGLISSRRRAQSVVHTRTSLGLALLEGPPTRSLRAL